MTKELVIKLGDSAADSFRQLHKDGFWGKSVKFYACRDVFNWGPVFKTRPVERLLALRQRAWRQVYKHRSKFKARPEEKLSDLIAQADRIDLMLGNSAQEQLLLLGVSALLIEQSPGADIRLFQYTSGDLSLLPTNEIAKRPEAITLGPDQLAELSSYWDIVCADTPDALFTAYHGKPYAASFPQVDNAFLDLLRHYPDAISGLNLSDRALLEACQDDWQRAIAVIGTTMATLFEEMRTGDITLSYDLVEMGNAALPCPAVELRGRAKHMRNCEVRITDFGRDYLSGARNYVRDNGINRWVGGVHLNSATNHVWYKDDESRLVIGV